jgi:ubiquinone biosynthesis protein Coq4
MKVPRKPLDGLWEFLDSHIPPTTLGYVVYEIMKDAGYTASEIEEMASNINSFVAHDAAQNDHLAGLGHRIM